jgi:hypothetical protein
MGLDDDEIYLCHNCVGEEYLSNTILINGALRICTYCKADAATISLVELADHIEGAFQRHYQRTSDQPDSFQHTMLADKESSYEWERSGEPVLWAIAEAANIDEPIALDVHELLQERYSDFDSDAMGEETEFSADSYYDWKRPDDIEFQTEWRAVENSLKTEARFFNRDASIFFERLFSDLSSHATEEGRPVVVEAGQDMAISSFFRARVCDPNSELIGALERPDRELAAPPSRCARSGRMNAQGISVFYGARDADTALAEVRPPVGSKVLVGRFDLLRSVRLLDVEALQTLYFEGSCFDPMHIGRLELAKFMKSLSARMTTPVMPNDEPTEYLITQMIADYLARFPTPRLDGMLYPSVQQSGNRQNVVLFNHSSRVEEWDIPRGTTIEADTYEHDDDGGHVLYYVSERIPPLDGSIKPKPLGWDDMRFSGFLQPNETVDSREHTLKLDATSVQVHHVEGVTFSTTSHGVSRHRREKGTMPF